MKTIKNICLLLASIVLCSSCSNDDDSSTPEPTVEELLTTTGRWYIESITGENMGNCDKTSYWEFSGESLNEQWFGTDTEDNCIAGYSTSYTYELISETQLNITNDDSTTEVTIESITETELTISYLLSGENTVVFFDKNSGNG